MNTIHENDTLNIAMVCDAVTDCVAGSFVSTLRFSERLRARGHNVIFIASRSPKSPRDDTYDGITAYRFPSVLLPKSEGQLRIGFATTKRIKEILVKEQIDVVHTTIPTPLALASTNAARALGIPVVAHSHTQPENLFLHLPRGPWVAVLDSWFYRYMSWLYGKADALIYPSLFAKERMSRITTTIRSLIVSNGVDTKRFAQGAESTSLEKYAIPTDALTILYAGRLHPEKSIDTLIRAMPLVVKKYPNAHLLIAGFGHLEPALRQLTKELSVGASVTFLGRVTDKEMAAAMNRCDIFVLPSLAELEGMVVLEAMACGKPIVVADAPESASTFFVQGNGYLFKERNPEDLALQIGKLIKDPELRGSMGQKSLIISREYDIDMSVRRLEELYHSLIETKSA